MNSKNEIDIELLHERFNYDPDTGIISYRTKIYGSNVPLGEEAGTLTSQGYRNISINRKMFKGHRVAWAMHYGYWPKNQIDHINRVKDDNRIANLREVTNSENRINTPARNKSGIKNLDLIQRGVWRVKITRDGKPWHGGCHPCLAHALKAREELLNELGTT